MIRFRRKEFTLQEGHYTGAKDTDKVPGALEVIGKSTIAGAVLGGAYGKLAKREDMSLLDGALTGAKWGSISGIFMKMFLNHLHKPMTSVKYQDIDRNIRQQFGIFKMTGVTVGDNMDRRTKLEERFSFNDRNISKYKINFAIHNNRITMYTLGITSDELEKVNKTLDYYCQKYFAMEYSARLINARVNAYSAEITFTNSHIAGKFIVELAETLQTRINILDNSAIVDSRIKEAVQEDDDLSEKTYSIGLSKNDYIQIISKGLTKYSPWSYTTPVPVAIMGVIAEGIGKLNNVELQRAGVLRARGDIGNPYLEAALKSLRFVEGFHYTVGEETSDFNISITSGLFMVTVKKDGDVNMESLKKYFNRSEFGKVYLYTCPVRSDQEFKMLLGKVMKLGKPNIFTGKKSKNSFWKK